MSLAKRWKDADQDTFIAAMICDPFVKIAPFRNLSRYFAPLMISSLMQRLWKRFFPTEPVPPSLHGQVMSYLNNTGEFEMLPGAINTLLDARSQEVRLSLTTIYMHLI